MLAALRRNSRNAIIYVLFGVIIAVFVINFGPGSGRGSCGGPAGSAYAAKVAGSTLTEQDFRFAYIAAGGTQYSSQIAQQQRLKEKVMDRLIERELLAQEGERLGFNVSHKEVEDMIYNGQMIIMGRQGPLDRYAFKDGKFDYERFKVVSQNQLGVSVVRFIEIERRELLADRVRELLRMGVKVSADDVKDDFVQQHTTVNLEYARFSAKRHEDDQEEITAADVDAYIKSHADELKKAYDDRAFLYKKVDRQARLRHIVIELPKDAPADKEAPIKKQLEDAKAKGAAGFAAEAKKLSAEIRSARKGGLIGWRKKGFTGFGDKLDAVVFAAKKGDIVGPERTDRGFHLVLVEDFREGDVPLEVAQREIAEELVLVEKAKAKARAEAEAVVAKVKGGAKLEDLFPKEAKKDEEDHEAKSPLKRLNDPPKLLETGMFSRRGESVPELGLSKELAKRAFELKPGEVAGPFDVPGGAAVVRLKERKDPDMADFEKRKGDLQKEQERAKWFETLDSWAKQRCTEVKNEGRLRVSDEILAYEQVAPGKTPPKSSYEPCSPNKSPF
jgi:peptidyl-prolyl cis-trans isomerase D